MNTVDRIKAICKDRKIPIARLEKDCGFANAYISGLKKGTVPADRLKTIAEYPGVSMETLMGIEEKPSIISPAMLTDKAFVEHIRMLFALPNDRRDFIYDCIESQYTKYQLRLAAQSVS